MKSSIINFQKVGKMTGVLVVGLLLGWLFFGGAPADQSQSMDEHVEEVHTNEEGEVVYTCSMHPSVRQSEPGDCPICGMELIPASETNIEGDTQENNYQLKMTEAAVRLAEIQTSEAVKEVAVKKIRLPGKVMVDERRIRSLPAHFPGRVEQLHVNFTGEYIAKGQKVASIYSPVLISAQKELLEAAKYKEQNPSLYQAARNKLLNWKIHESRIDQIEQAGKIKTAFDITSHMDGIVIKRNLATGDHVEMGTVMYRMADLSKLWVTFEAYERDLAGLEEGDKVAFTVEAYPGEIFEAEITYIDPTLDPQSRTATVRAEAANPDRRLKPQMLAEGIISSEIANGKEQVLIPKSAVLWTGERSVVYVHKTVDGQPVFEFREVELGPRAGERYVVKSGVEVGEKVVTNGNFKIDSAAQLAGKASMMNKNPDGSMPTGHDHGSIEMETSKADTGSHQHTDHLSSLIESYLSLKGSLAEDQFEEAQNHLETFRKEVTQSTDMNNHPEHSEMHWKHHAAMVKTVEAEAETLEQLRSAFIVISENLMKAVDNQGFDKQELYLQYCPMADNKKGATWISENKKISNPYMGQEMSTCGSTERTITQGS